MQPGDISNPPTWPSPTPGAALPIHDLSPMFNLDLQTTFLTALATFAALLVTAWLASRIAGPSFGSLPTDESRPPSRADLANRVDGLPVGTRRPRLDPRRPGYDD